MLRRTVVIAVAMFAVWAIGVSSLAFVPPTRNGVDAGASIGRGVLHHLGTSVYVSRQDPSGKYTVIVRSPGRGYGEQGDFTDS